LTATSNAKKNKGQQMLEQTQKFALPKAKDAKMAKRQNIPVPGLEPGYPA
jgi:hypothetical protein